MSDDVVIGKFGRPHGVRGEVRFFVYNPESQVVAPKVTLQLVDGKREHVSVSSVRPADKFLILSLTGVADREAASVFSSREASVPRDSLPEPADDEFYLVDVIGFEVWAPPTDGEEMRLLGTVHDWVDVGPSDIMAVKGPEIRNRLLIPNIEHVVESFDFETKRVLLHPLDTWAPEDD